MIKLIKEFQGILSVVALVCGIIFNYATTKAEVSTLRKEVDYVKASTPSNDKWDAVMDAIGQLRLDVRDLRDDLKKRR